MKPFGDVVTETLCDGERFHIHKVFTMEPKYKGAYIRYDPKTREEVEVPPHIKVKTVIGTELERALYNAGDSLAD